jgi:hypothetical protein
MLIYRIEDADGHGPFADGGMGRGEERARSHPAPGRDRAVRGWSSYWDGRGVFGCASLECVLQWFSAEALASLDKHGFMLNVYEVREQYVYTRLLHQVTFNAAQSHRLMSVELPWLLNLPDPGPSPDRGFREVE